jgi:hypothetical protein
LKCYMYRKIEFREREEGKRKGMLMGWTRDGK